VNQTLDQTDALTHRAPAALRVEFLTTLAELAPLEQQWESLNQKLSDHDAPFFQSYAWCRHVARVRLRNSPRRYKLLVATLRRGANLVGIWPLSLQRGSGAWIARSLDDPFGQFAGVLFDNEDDIAAGVAAVLHALRTRTEADGTQIEAVVAGSALHRALLAAGADTSEANQAVYVDLRPYASFGEFQQSVNKKTRKNLRNLRNRFQRTHGFSEKVLDQPEQLAPLIEQTFAARSQWMDRFGRTSPAFRDGDFKAMVTGLAVASGVSLLGFSLSTEESFAAAQWGFLYMGRYYAYVSARDPKYNEFSPGRMHLGMVIEACLARGIKVLELMPPASAYKLDWTDRLKRLDVAVMPFTLRGRWAMKVMAAWGAPKMRTLSRALPEFIRKPLVRRLNRGG
jgi:CelD/BcsL family acetyltransferase involved in cellulose biosynthesis